MKSSAEIKEFRGLAESELTERISSTEQELMNLRFKHASAQLDQTAQLKQLRRRIARLKTAQTEARKEAQNDSAQQSKE